MNKKSKIAFLSLLALLLLPLAAHAARDTSLLTMPTTSKNVAFIFHKLANRKPEFDRAIRDSAEFKSAPASEQEKILDLEERKLAIEFANIDPKREVIVARSAVELEVNTINNPGLKVKLPGTQGSALYFPYSWAGQDFALIPDQFDLFLNLPMTQVEASAASARIGGGAAAMVVELRAIAADGNRQMVLDGMPQWLLMTKVLAVTFYNQYLETIWSWQSPDYKRPGSGTLQSLKK